jgi:enamine deaminase RidA (YjgF/YER057c/UK114 family)
MSDHQLINPEELAPAIGFSHAVVACSGRTIYFAGQTALSKDNEIVGNSLPEQFEMCLKNLRIALEGAGAGPEHLVQLQLFVTNLADYRAARSKLGEIWQRHLGRHYPAIALVAVTALYDEKALVEITAIAVIPKQ